MGGVGVKCVFSVSKDTCKKFRVNLQLLLRSHRQDGGRARLINTPNVRNPKVMESNKHVAGASLAAAGSLGPCRSP